MIGIRCQGDATKVGRTARNLISVDYVVLTAGTYDAIVEVVCADDSGVAGSAQHRFAVPGDVDRDARLPETR